MRGWAAAVLLVTLAAVAAGFWYTASQLKSLAAAQRELARLNEQLGQLRGELLAGHPAGDGAEPPGRDALVPRAEDLELRSAAQVSAAIEKMGTSPTAQAISDCLVALDSWTIRPEDEVRVRQLKLDLAARLRGCVKKEIGALQRSALETAVGNDRPMDAPTCADASRLHAEAGRILALYPMAEDRCVIEEAKALSARQAEVANRIEVIRRQRYNRWATQMIEAAINGYNSKSSYWSPKKENPLLIGSLVDCLCQVDPVLLEPAVLELYNYIVDLTKESISEADKIDLARRLTAPSIRRRTLGDF